MQMLRASGRRHWRCRIYATLVLVLTGLALLITWKHLPDERYFGKRFRSTVQQTTDTAGSNYFDIRQPVDKVSVQKVTLVHAERSYPEKNGTAASDASESTSSSTQDASQSPPATTSGAVLPEKSTAIQSSTFFPSPDGSVLPSSEPSKSSLDEQELANRKALIESSMKV